MKLRFSALMAALFVAACGSGSPGKDGANGADGNPGEPGQDAPPAVNDVAISQVNPRVGLVDRALTVTIATDGTIDLKKATADFGDGVEVVDTRIIGSSLEVDIAIAPNAKLGKHDVVVSVGKTKLEAKKAFHVAVPLDAKISGGKAEQGGLVRLDVWNRDRIWFDPDRFTLFSLADPKDPSLIPLAHMNFTTTDGTVVLLGDPMAKTGALGFLGVNDPADPDSASFLTEPNVVDVAARTPIALTSGTPTEVTFDKELQTGFFVANYAPTGNEGFLVDAIAQVPAGSTHKPLLIAYPASGNSADMIDQKVEDPGFPEFGIPGTEARIAYPVTGASKGYFVVVDAELGHGPTTKLAMQYTATRAQILNEKADPHDTAETGQNLGSLPGVTTTVGGRVVKGELKAAGEKDYYRFTGLSATNMTDMLVSVVSDVDIVVRVDTAPTLDSDGLVEVVPGGKGGMALSNGHVGATRFISVQAAPGAKKATGTYTLGFKRVAAPPQ